jgi:hypothetical protein
MEFVFYFFGFSVVTMGLILHFDKWQSQRINKILRETKDVQPLFLMRSAEEKLRNLNIKLYGNSMAVGSGVQSGRVYMNEGARQLITAQLTEVVNSYNCGNIDLKEYSLKLTELTNLLNEVKGMSFEQSQYQRPTFASLHK